ncbi:MAG: alpha-glucan family phosphorylase [Bacteroidales bacterium]|nr:alpha-glucan family phosphorylase [Bacteroidales bacterium]
MKKADYIFETSWEICNKVGGIHTVISTKAFTITEQYHNNYICIGPNLSREDGANDEFEEDLSLYKSWREVAATEGLRIRIGRWKISGSPVVVLVDFTPFFEKKNEILTHFWEKYRLDSISGQWDYIEPALFGYAAGRVIESFYQFHCAAQDKIVAQFHEWMTGAGILYLEEAVPQIATVFTTHATVLGRCIAGNGLPLYENMSQYEPISTAARFGVQSKASLEYLSAKFADASTTVSEITNKECVAFLQKNCDAITINGFENNFVPQGAAYDEKRSMARAKLHDVASALLQQPIAEDALFVINSGRYEFKNKGIDLFLASLASLKNQDLKREVVAFITVPAGTSGQRTELIDKLKNKVTYSDGSNAKLRDYATHPLHDAYNDPIIRRCNELNLDNAPESKVKVVFVPTYLNGHDGIFNLSYYDLLIGFDLSVFPSYYEPWGYTPLESIAFGIPTVTTSLTGFGLWVNEQFGGNGQQNAVRVIERTDTNDEQVCSDIARSIVYYAQCSENETAENSKKATEISQSALWKNLFDNYLKAYDLAITQADDRFEMYKSKTSKIGLMVPKTDVQAPKWTRITFKSQLTDKLQKLYELAHNLWWSWNYEARELFMEIAGPMWSEYDENPVHILQFLPLEVIEKFSNNKAFLAKLDAVYQKFQNYMNTPRTRPEEKVAYFSMEFGISNELKIFSGGLGMLAGDYLKEASDCNVNMVAVGLLYRCGYFTQQISPNGEQINLYPNQSFSKLPMKPVKDEHGNFLTVGIGLPGRTLFARIWRVDVGRVPLYLLDTDFRANSEEDRRTTYQLYGGDWENRLKQEFLLGVGGIRMLNKLGEKPTVYHLNEGHAAFLNLERLRNVMEEHHLPFGSAVEVIRASSLFTTHTPVPAGHDAFSEDMMRTYFSNYPERYNISWQTFMGLGREHIDCVNDKFSMSILACKLSQEINGVSRIHGRVSREMFTNLYDGRFANELHISYVTNGVHYPTWAHKKWQQFHTHLFGDQFLKDQSNPEIWKRIYEVKDSDIWTIKEELRKELIDNVKVLLEGQMRRRNESPALIVKTLGAIRDDVLTIGFARRFATYKRAHLLFSDEERLRTLLNNPNRPIQFLFAGKAHPHDKAGQDLIKRIIEFSRKPDFIGKIIFLENYDMILAKKLVSGCDVWMNTPTRPLEASGTSGEKAIMNGVLNLSVLDGWWAEGYVKGGGWAINEEITYTDNRLQDELDAATIYTLIENEVAETFYKRDEEGIPAGWVQMMKNNFYMISPHFTMKRQLDDYYEKFYHKLENRTAILTSNANENVKKLVRWKEKMLTGWDSLEMVSVEYPQCEEENTFSLGHTLKTTLQLRLGSIQPEDLKIEFVFIVRDNDKATLADKYPFHLVKTEGGVTTFECDIDAKLAGVWNCAIRIIPSHTLLPHDMDFNLVKWM